MASLSLTDPRYGWVLVVGGLLTIAFQAAIFFAMALLLVAIPDDTGWSRATTAAALSSMVIGTGAWSPIVGAALARWGPRRTMMVGGMVTAAGLIAMSQARSPEELAVAILLLISPGNTSMGSLTIYTVLQDWFRARRGTALSIADSGASFGLMLIVPMVQQLMLVMGWRQALMTLAIGALALAALNFGIQRPPPFRETADGSGSGRPERAAGLLGLLRQPGVWLICLGLATSRFAFQLVTIHQVAYLTDQGFDAAHLASVFAFTGLAGIVGRPGFGWLSDRFGGTPVYAALISCLLVAIASLIVAGQTGLTPALWVFALSFGSALGVGTLLFARQVSDVVGRRDYGSALGLGYALGSVGGASGATAAAMVYDATGTYLTSFAAAAVMALVSLGCMSALGRFRQRPAALAEPPEPSTS